MSRSRYALTLMAPTADFDFAPVRSLLDQWGLTVDDERQLPVPKALRALRDCRVLLLEGVEDASRLRAALEPIGDDLGADLVLQRLDVRHADYRLAVFDMDSTLIECEVIDELAARHGVGDAVAAITERAMRGELDFNGSFTERLGMLRGLDADVIADIADNLPVTEGVRQLIPTLRARGIHTAILSGGFVPFAQRLQAELGFDEIHANSLEIAGNALTGRVVPPIVNGERKAALVDELRERLGLRPDQVIAVGDGANDLPMLSRAGLGLAFRAKPLVRAKAGHNIRRIGLDGLAYLLGALSEIVERPN